MISRRTLLKSSALLLVPFAARADSLSENEQLILDLINENNTYMPRLFTIYQSGSWYHYGFIWFTPGEIKLLKKPHSQSKDGRFTINFTMEDPYRQDSFVAFPKKPSLDWNKINRAAGYQVCLWENLHAINHTTS